MAAALLAPGTSTITNVPDILDVEIMAELLRRLGCDGRRTTCPSSTVRITVPQEPDHRADYDLVRRMRASICVLGPLVARVRRGGRRPARRRQHRLPRPRHARRRARRMGAHVTSEHGYLLAQAPDGLTGARTLAGLPERRRHRDHPHGGGAGRGETVIDNAAREPEIVDICLMLQAMGARIDGIGTSTLTIEGVDALHPVEHATVPDRIVAGTWAVAAAMTRGDVTIRNADAGHLEHRAGEARDRRRRGRRARRRLPGGHGARARRPSTSSRSRTRASRPTCSRSSSR